MSERTGRTGQIERTGHAGRAGHAGRIERVVVPLDSASESEVAIDTAARLAALWGVPLHGLFIEDEELLELADLPFGAQVTLGAGTQRLSRGDIERHLRASAERARRQLLAAAARYHGKGSFAVVRGPLDPALLKAGDFVVASAATRPIGGHFRMRGRWWSAIAGTRHPLLLARRRWETGGSVLTLLRRHAEDSARLLALAAEIADLGRREMTVLSDIAPEAEPEREPEAEPEREPEAEPEAAPEREPEERPEPAAAARAPAPRTERGGHGPAALKERMVALDCRLLVLAAEGASPEDLRPIVEAALCDLLVIGEEADKESGKPS